MLIVVAIIGLLATIVLFAVSRARKKAVASQMKAHIEEIMKGLEMAATDGVTSIDIVAGNSMVSGGITYIQKVPSAPSCTGCSYTGLGTGVDTSSYSIGATGFEGADTFTCTNGSCYCSTNGGCLAIP
jgi:type II secretory pathway pseudopilin PulG